MIADFEQRLAEVLDELMPAPFAGRVQVAPGDVPDDEPAVLLGVTRAERLPDDLGGTPRALAPGADEPRRVVRLRCTVTLRVRPGDDEGRAQQLAGLDAALYALDEPAFRRGGALAGGDPDPGFLVHDVSVLEGLAPLDPADPLATVALSLRAEGLFWPPGLPGQTGAQIGVIRLRGAVLPLEVIVPATAELVAGGPAVTLTIRVGSVGTQVLEDGEPLAASGFGRLALSLRGAGTLQGGAAGSNGARLVVLDDGSAEIDYVPPAAAGRDELVVALEDGEGGAGIELGRRRLQVRAA